MAVGDSRWTQVSPRLWPTKRLLQKLDRPAALGRSGIKLPKSVTSRAPVARSICRVGGNDAVRQIVAHDGAPCVKPVSFPSRGRREQPYERRCGIGRSCWIVVCGVELCLRKVASAGADWTTASAGSFKAPFETGETPRSFTA